jgi:hypothetical protein
MSTIMKDGNRVCNGTCHNATKPHCTCICGGKFHGANVLRTKSAEQEEMKQILLARVVLQIEQGLDAVSKSELDQPHFDFGPGE